MGLILASVLVGALGVVIVAPWLARKILNWVKGGGR